MERIVYVARHVLPNWISAIALPAFVTWTVMITGSPGRYVCLSTVTETTNRAAGAAWLKNGAGANTRTATGHVRVAAIATARSTQYGPSAARPRRITSRTMKLTASHALSG